MSLMNMLFTGNEARLYSDLRVTGSISGMTAANAPTTLSLQPGGGATTVGGDLTVLGAISSGGAGDFIVSGNVGVGTTAPQAKLHVYNTAESDCFRVDHQSSGANPVVINKDGQMGLGTADPQNMLTIRRAATGLARIGLDTTSAGGQIFTEVGSEWGVLKMLNKGVEIESENGRLMTITEDSRVGINLTNPGSKLSVSGGVSVGSYATNDAGDGNIIASGRVGVGIASPTATVHINHTGSDDILRVEDETAPDSTPFIIKADGKVGVGVATVSANSKMEVAGYVKQQPLGFCARAIQSQSWSFAASSAGIFDVNFGGSLFNYQSCYNTTNSTFTAPISGVYIVHCRIIYVLTSSTVSTTTTRIVLNRNGTDEQAFVQGNDKISSGTTLLQNIDLTTIIALNANDTLKIRFQPYSTTGSVTFTAGVDNATMFMAHLLNPL